MDKEKMLKEFEEYLKREYNDAVAIIDSSPWWCSTWKEKLEMICNTLQRGLGAAQFIQMLGVSFEECDAFYEAFRNDLMDLHDKI